MADHLRGYPLKVKKFVSVWSAVLAGTAKTADAIHAARTAIVISILISAGTKLTALDAEKSVYQFNLQTWTVERGLPDNHVQGIAQTPDGILWYATATGLVKYDGLDFINVLGETVQKQTQVVSRFVRAPQGVILADTADGPLQLDSRNGGLLKVPGFEKRDQTIFFSKTGDVWIGSVSGARVHNSAVRISPEVASKLGLVMAFAEDTEGAIWIATAERGIFVWDGKELRALESGSVEPRRVTSMVADLSGSIWVGSDRGIERYGRKGNSERVPEFDIPIREIYADGAGTLWIATQGKGIGRFSHGQLSFLRKKDGLAGDFVNCFFEDREGSLWVGTSEGVTQISEVRFPLVSEKEGILGGSVHAVSAAREGGVWISSSEGLSRFGGKGEIKRFGREYFHNPYVKLAYEASNGVVYVATGDKVISALFGDRIIAQLAVQDWPESFAEDAEGPLLAAGPVLYRIKNDQLVPFAYREGATPNPLWINYLTVAKDGAILLAASNGVFRIKEGGFRHWSEEQGITDGVNMVLQDDDGTIWAATLNGVARIRDGVVRTCREENGLPDGKAFAMIADDQGSFWIQSLAGLVRVSRATLNDYADGRIPRVECELFNTSDSIKTVQRTDQAYSVARSADGQIWFPSPKGAVKIAPSRYWRNSTPPSISIEPIQAPVERGQWFMNFDGAEFSFRALTYVNTKKAKLAYRLEGLDQNWIEAGERHSVRFSHLAPGDYRFAVQATNGDGITATKAYAFSVRVPFYRTQSFYLGCAVIVLLSVTGIYIWRVQRAIQRQKKLAEENLLLEARVEERTRELAREQSLVRALLDNSSDRIYFKDTESRYIGASSALALNFGLASPKDLTGRTDFDFLAEMEAKAAYEEERNLILTGKPLVGKIEHELTKDGREAWLLTTKMPLRNAAGAVVGSFGVSKDITEIKRAEARLEVANRQFVEVSRQAGMAEVATSVLHNIGNVLNSVNISAGVLVEDLQALKPANIGKIAELLETHRSDIAAFINTDPKGQKIVPYLTSASLDLEQRRHRMVTELENLSKNIEHIKDIVAAQQNLAKGCSFREAASVVDTVDDAIRLHASEFERHRVLLRRDFQASPVITTERHKVLQVVINLLRNACEACVTAGGDSAVTVRISQDDMVRISVIDTGVGIPVENLVRIFSYGMTTKPNGHGFGLHGSALAAGELGGNLTAHSEGAGRGATFVLALPLA